MIINRLFSTCELDQWHNFNNVIIEEFGENSILKCAMEYIGNRWDDYQHFIGDDSKWENFLEIIKEKSYILRMFNEDLRKK